ncbi:MAG TPA: hypothetical protein VNO14_10820 [Blastocatellia bacterium]|nr:hypothetical protein [Blastocatellia bacterium]
MQPIRVEIRGRDEFWGRAFHVEWEHQYPDRRFIAAGPGCFLVDPAWLGDVERVAAQCFCEVVRAPDNPRRRRWLKTLGIRGQG